MYNDQLVYKVVIWKFFGISLWKEKVALTTDNHTSSLVFFRGMTSLAWTTGTTYKHQRATL